VVDFYFTFCPIVTKRGSNFYFWNGIVFLTGQVIFIPKWPKGEFVSLKLAAFCWSKTLPCNDAL
jgi:predicted membrane channel-forming protein YqfA (hemolysin III family)